MKLYMFRTVHLSVIRSLFTVHSAMVYVIHVCRRCTVTWTQNSWREYDIRYRSTAGMLRLPQLTAIPQTDLQDTSRNEYLKMLTLAALVSQQFAIYL